SDLITFNSDFWHDVQNAWANPHHGGCGYPGGEPPTPAPPEQPPAPPPSAGFNNPAAESAAAQTSTLPRENISTEISTLNQADIQQYLQPKAGSSVIVVGDGSQNQDGQLIQNALNNSRSGQTIELNGEFNINQQLTMFTNDVSIIAGPNGAT